MGFKESISRFFRVNQDDEYVDYEIEDETEVTEHALKRGQAPTKIREGKDMAKINIIEPRVYSEVETIASLLLDKQAALLNLRRVDDTQARRIIDYLAGIAYAIGGDVQKLSESIFLCVPANIEIEGMLNEENQSRLDFLEQL
ncbi:MULTISPECIES: cell division protein SepF [unclassified Granulicatella]|uniref:cell division protein SepF n=1 Tax=unclassified Granulicatella TaxID=2630493 RepID=UPI0010731956|nr:MULTISPECIES: cell division protein SepF [unclassified Granulicatella]MBF0780415.1 cell division protein SepF [Granulicatella sp. 19428wC4_WM01]TFU95452.1 DUF552 domain-containing protein [Granulicatella sp. WM01]